VTVPAAGALGTLTLNPQLVDAPTAREVVWHCDIGCGAAVAPRLIEKVVIEMATTAVLLMLTLPETQPAEPVRVCVAVVVKGMVSSAEQQQQQSMGQ
jgi:hypothetical protein